MKLIFPLSINTPSPPGIMIKLGGGHDEPPDSWYTLLLPPCVGPLVKAKMMELMMAESFPGMCSGSPAPLNWSSLHLPL